MMMRTLFVLGSSLVVSLAILASAQRADAKGNDAWVLTGGALGDYAMAGVSAELYDMPTAVMVPAPAIRPTPRYDLYDSSNNFAVPYQMWRLGGAWVHYYPTADLLEFQGSDAANVPHRWYRPLPEIAATLRQAVDTALAEKAAGRLDASPAAADFRARSLDRVDYRVSPYNTGGTVSAETRTFYATDHGEFQIHGQVSREFVMKALVDTVSRPPAGSTFEPPVYEITYAGNLGSGAGIGGLLGYYTPPSGGHSGRFWDEDYAYGGTPFYETTPEFDAIIARGLDTQPPSAAATPSAVTAPERSRSRVLVAAFTAFGVVAGLGGLGAVARRRRGS